jgi:sulfide:quinone oxidoreductase
MSLPVLGPAGCNVIEGRLAENSITFLPNHKATAVEKSEIVFAAERRPYDLLLGVPPHHCPIAIVQSGLTEGGNWVRVNSRTMETKFPGVYAAGDCVEIPLADGKPLPKAGVFAEAMGEVAADRIAATLAGRESAACFTGEGGCYLEVGSGEAMMVRGRFLAEASPEVILTESSHAFLEEKRSFEAQRLQTWFS